VCLNSLKNYTYYKFNKDKIQSIKVIKGKRLLFLVAINLIFLSYLIVDYIYINFDLILNLLLEGINVPKPDISQLSFFIFLISILLILKKSRFLLKKLILINFILISLYLWHLQINNIKVDAAAVHIKPSKRTGIDLSLAEMIDPTIAESSLPP